MHRCHSALITHLFEIFCCPIVFSSGRVSTVALFHFSQYDVFVMNGDFCFQVFSAFGFVHKIATFEKAAGFQVYN